MNTGPNIVKFIERIHIEGFYGKGCYYNVLEEDSTFETMQLCNSFINATAQISSQIRFNNHSKDEITISLHYNPNSVRLTSTTWGWFRQGELAL